MSALKLEAIACQTEAGIPYHHLRVRILSPDGIVAPEDLRDLEVPPETAGSKGVVIEGKSPIWLYCYLTHACHATPWVGCYDPRLGGAVVVESHDRNVSVGSVLKLALP